jgi:CDP-diglyceride synthetase
VTAAPPAEALRYSHTQVGWWLIAILGVVCLAIVAIFNGVAVGRQSLPPTDARIIGWVVFVTLLITAALLTTLTVRVTSDTVTWRFGPGVVRFSLPLSEITSVATARTPLWAGIGIHWIFTGWVYNVSGRDAVELTKRDGSKVWIGTDEPDALAAAIDGARSGIASTGGNPPGSRRR